MEVTQHLTHLQLLVVVLVVLAVLTEVTAVLAVVAVIHQAQVQVQQDKVLTVGNHPVTYD
jgi:hypothetical protein